MWGLVVEADSWWGPENPAGRRFLYQHDMYSDFSKPEISFHSKVIIESMILIGNCQLSEEYFVMRGKEIIYVLCYGKSPWCISFH